MKTKQPDLQPSRNLGTDCLMECAIPGFRKGSTRATLAALVVPYGIPPLPAQSRECHMLNTVDPRAGQRAMRNAPKQDLRAWLSLMQEAGNPGMSSNITAGAPMVRW